MVFFVPGVLNLVNFKSEFLTIYEHRPRTYRSYRSTAESIPC